MSRKFLHQLAWLFGIIKTSSDYYIREAHLADHIICVSCKDSELHLPFIRRLASVHSRGKYTDNSNPPLKGIVRVLNPFSGHRIYSRKSLYKNFATPTLSVMTTAPRLSLG